MVSLNIAGNHTLLPHTNFRLLGKKHLLDTHFLLVELTETKEGPLRIKTVTIRPLSFLQDLYAQLNDEGAEGLTKIMEDARAFCEEQNLVATMHIVCNIGPIMHLKSLAISKEVLDINRNSPRPVNWEHILRASVLNFAGDQVRVIEGGDRIQFGL